MKQLKKSQISRDKILNAAIAEFGTKSYENASINNICNDNNISKGLIYHYFKNKDELFLNCVKTCFDALVNYLSKEDFYQDDIQNSIEKYLDLRYRFFREYPYYSQIFFNALLQPPMHLKEQIKDLRNDFDALNISQYRKTICNLTLREGITEEEAIEYFFFFQEMFNGYFQSRVYESSDFNFLIEAHEVNLQKILNIILYGIAKEE
ncbi:TetR/AcrR family transcriptional regulator [Alkaliphilus sp. MSJ-5]|uniref:TetR/AcrR family transcriptional regulator n=1 Tax=Alkaliphilus flagellatus TaxID=2841507 RepID=A0ABS6G116_9FIRM|nr:TetR/AcrR family transcriptional regulator [Alkaliphilus flagellatus]MBU5675422.1 TetR/AcrR family transcriptional regulator [Alkaliphilus flagellatus]